MIRAGAGLGVFTIQLRSLSRTVSVNLSQALKAVIQTKVKKLEKDILISHVALELWPKVLEEMSSPIRIQCLYIMLPSTKEMQNIVECQRNSPAG